jgi:adenine phosphoribosyltransferase
MKIMQLENLKSLIRDVYDFPTKGIIFRDLTTLLKNGEALQTVNHNLADLYRDKGVTKVVGIESRGFICGSILAYELGCGFVPARKPGKLPAVTIKKSYAKEYGVDMIELHSDAICSDDVVVIHDDLLATGGTMLACYELVKSMNPKKIYFNFVVELTGLKGRDVLPADCEVTSLLKY